MSNHYNLDRQLRNEAQQLEHLKKMRSGFDASKRESPTMIIVLLLSFVPFLCSHQLEPYLKPIFNSARAALVETAPATTGKSVTSKSRNHSPKQFTKSLKPEHGTRA